MGSGKPCCRGFAPAFCCIENGDGFGKPAFSAHHYGTDGGLIGFHPSHRDERGSLRKGQCPFAVGAVNLSARRGNCGICNAPLGSALGCLRSCLGEGQVGLARSRLCVDDLSCAFGPSLVGRSNAPDQCFSLVGQPRQGFSCVAGEVAFAIAVGGEAVAFDR